MLCQRVTVLLCAFFSVCAMLVGVLPVRGWPLNPRPWPAALAWLFAFSMAQYMMLCGGMSRLYSESTTGNDALKIAITVYHAMLRELEGWEKCWRRVELCALARCLRLYCAAHPLSAAGWKAAMLPVMFCCFHTVDSQITGTWWTANACRRREFFETMMWSLYNGLMTLFAMGLPNLTGILVRELRLDCERAVRAAAAGRGRGVLDPEDTVDEVLAWAAGHRRASPLAGGAGAGVGSPHDEHFWRWLRLRHMVVLDMSRMACSLMHVQVLILNIFTFTFSTTSISTAIGSIVDVGARNDPNFLVCLVSPLHAAAERLVLFTVACVFFQLTAREQGKLCHDLEGFLAHSPDVPGAVAREVKGFILQIVLQDGHFDILGLFRMDLGVLKSVLAATMTYLVVLVQFKVSLY